MRRCWQNESRVVQYFYFKNILQFNSWNTKSVCFKSQAVNNKLLQKYRKSVYLRDLKRKSSPSVVVCSSSSLSLTHLCITPRSPRLYLNFSLLHSSKQAATDVVQIPACGALERRAVCAADVESQRKRRREARLPQLPEVGLRTRRSGDEGDVAAESLGRRNGFREAAREQEGVRHGLQCCQKTSVTKYKGVYLWFLQIRVWKL